MMSLNHIFQCFTPKDKNIFFPLLEQVAHNVVTMATLLMEVVVKENTHLARETLLKKIAILENKGDEITHQIFLGLSKTFITPFDREDIHALASAIDDVADYIHGAASRMRLYQIEEITSPIVKLSELIVQASTHLEKAINELKRFKNIQHISDSCILINSIENQADTILGHALGDLFLHEKDAIKLIKYKEILTALESATDVCEDAANVLESILVKHG